MPPARGTKVHVEVASLRRRGYEIVMIGHRGHPTEGTMGQSDEGMHLVDRCKTLRRCKCAHALKWHTSRKRRYG